MRTIFHSHKLAALAGVAMLATTVARAVDYHVATAQQLQNALTLAAASSVSNNIYVTNGYYTGNFNFNSTNVNSLTLRAETNVAGSQIVIDGGGTGSSMNIIGSASPNITVQGMTFLRNCGSVSLAGLQIAGGNTAILVDGCQFLSPTNSSGIGLQLTAGLNAQVTNCTAGGWSQSANYNGAAGISISGVTGNVTVEDCTMTANDIGLYVSGAYLVALTNCLITGNFGGAVCSGTTITFSGNYFTGNLPISVNWTTYGGAYCYGTTITLSGNTFTGNLGGGAYCYGTTVTLSGNSFNGNLVNGVGGGVYCYGTTTTFTGNTFTGNSATYGYPVSWGGGAFCSGTTVTLSGNTFAGNSVSNATGAVYGAPNNGGGGFFWSGAGTSATLTLLYNTFTDNSAVLGQNGGSVSGGGLYASGPTISLIGNLVANNSVFGISSQGGGLWVDASATLNMVNNTVTGNTSAGSGGGAAYVVTGTVELLNVYNNIIWGNLATVSGGDVYLSGTGQRKVFNFNDADSYYGVWDVAQNNIDLSPSFFNPVSGDYHLQSTSPCANAGTISAPSLPLTDLDGNSRTNSAGLVDLGCYEFNTTTPHPADTNGNFVMTANKYNAYAAAWKAGQMWTNGPNPGPNPVLANYVTRAGYLAYTNRGIYTNIGSARPTNWRPSGQ